MTADKDALLREAVKLLKDEWDGTRPDSEGNSLIARITAALAEKEGGWIKCSERLPENCDYPKPYLVLREKHTAPEIGYYCTNYDSPYPWSGGGSLGVTHWRPLPPLPKGDK